MVKNFKLYIIYKFILYYFLQIKKGMHSMIMQCFKNWSGVAGSID